MIYNTPKMIPFFLAFLIWLAFMLSADAADRLMVEYSKEPIASTSGLAYKYTFKVKSHHGGKPVEGADFMVSTDMPAMPGAHHMPHVKNQPGHHPGTYTVKLDFDMPGEWNLILKFSKPHRDQVVIRETIKKHGDKMGDKTDHSKHKTGHSGHGHKKKKH